MIESFLVTIYSLFCIATVLALPVCLVIVLARILKGSDKKRQKSDSSPLAVPPQAALPEDEAARRGREGEAAALDVLRLLIPVVGGTIHSNVTLRTWRGQTSQVDHLLVCTLGVFVIEMKNMRGEIYCRPWDDTWTQRMGTKSYPFQNPLLQNYWHMQAIMKATGVHQRFLHPVVVFADAAGFPRGRPDGVLALDELSKWILSHREPLLDPRECESFAARLERARLPVGAETDRLHVRNARWAKFNKSVQRM